MIMSPRFAAIGVIFKVRHACSGTLTPEGMLSSRGFSVLMKARLTT
jgi:hypothetical protein